MAYPQLVSQNYNNLGGINEKASEYTTQRTQFLKLFNVDFRVPNALAKRDGSTQIIATGTSGKISSMYEYIKSDGASYIFAGSDVGLFQKTGATLTLGFSASSQFDFVTYNDQMWAANGATFVNFNGSTFYPFGANAFHLFSSGGTTGTDVKAPFVFFGVSPITGGNGFSFGLGATKYVMYHFEPIKFNGQRLNNAYEFLIDVDQFTGQTLAFNYPAITRDSNYSPTDYSAGLSGIYIGFTIGDNSFGIEKFNIYRYVYDSASVTPSPNGGLFTLQYWPNLTMDEFSYIATIDATDGSFTDKNGDELDPFPQGPAALDSINPFRVSQVDFNQGATPFTQFSASFVYTPKYQEIFNDSLIMAGFSGFPSRFWFSEIGEPEYILPENFVNVRTNDGDRITGIKAYLDQLVIFKEKSFHRLTGDDAANYTLAEISTEYGCLNNTSIVEAENILYFLDKKGIVKYNGTSWILQSFPVEDTVNRINIEAAKDEAFAIHKKQDNQIWFAVPVDESLENNLILVYDYVLDAWTMHDGLNVSSFAIMKGQLDRQRLHFGSYSGLIQHFSPDFKGDNGQGFTCLALSRYESPQGANVEKIFRRLFVDMNVESGSSTIVSAKGFKNYNGATPVVSVTLSQSVFQQRKDFGVSARSMAFEFSHNSATDGFQFNGYGLATRYLRDE